jgi:hypothetical protein
MKVKKSLYLSLHDGRREETKSFDSYLWCYDGYDVILYALHKSTTCICKSHNKRCNLLVQLVKKWHWKNACFGKL